jgi:hypothetical protein
MTKSLNAILPALGDILDEPPDTLRTRQRALVAARLLDSKPGKGPGSGVPATPKALAQFLIGTCTGADGPFARGIARATPAGTMPTGTTRLTDAATFVEELAAILSDEALAKRVKQIRIVTRGGLVDINYDEASLTTFLGKAVKMQGLMFQVVIYPKTLIAIADLIKETEQ